MTFQLRGAVAVITGAGGGIGAALADILAARGCALALADIDATTLEAVAVTARRHGVTVSTHHLDVADPDQVAALPQAVLAAHGRVSVLVNNAGVALGGTFDEVPEAAFDWLMAVNFSGTVRMTRAFLPLLRREPAAHIVNLSSLFGIIAPPGQVAYVASKFAVRGFSEALRHELEGSPVSLTVVHPGGVRTGIAVNARRYGLSNRDVEAQAKTWDKLLRLSPDVAAAAIAGAIERRAKRLLIGQDARQAAWLQRLVPVDYWSIIRTLMR
ncbi:SDR family oxidoreductase [Beijerinckia sp. L45]|uniref:SDR family NAD(P)-dependent oxidoreductase n=1 Tax=Beijerinckia sp. L45 TaxID=1641855 RepID=UPI001AED2BDF|nr:SDR family oxidoreductase [Beijerinckia sp. L45]